MTTYDLDPLGQVEDYYRWDPPRMNYEALDTDEDIFKWHADQLDRINEMQKALNIIEDQMEIVRELASSMNLHPEEIVHADGAGNMDELLYFKTQVLKQLTNLRNRLPLLLNTD